MSNIKRSSPSKDGQPQPQHEEGGDGEGDGEVDGDRDGSSIMGRAANIASTAKDLLGSFWYGNNESGGTASPSRSGSGTGPSSGGEAFSALGGLVGGPRTGRIVSGGGNQPKTKGKHVRSTSFG